MIELAVALAAGAGSVSRYVLDRVVQHRTRGEFPYGTLIVNITGSLLLGVVIGLAAHHGLAADTALVLGVGFAGGYTTLSTWAWESLALAESGELGQAALNVAGSFALGLVAAGVGLGLAAVIR